MFARLPIWLIVALVAAPTASATVWMGRSLPSSSTSARSADCPLVDRQSARSVVSAFVQTAVQRRHTGCSYGLVSRRPADGLECLYDSEGNSSCYDRAHWASGDIPVVPQVGTAPFVVRFAPDSESLAVVGMTCRSEVDIGSCTAFYRVALRRSVQGWVVAYWMPAWQPAAPAS